VDSQDQLHEGLMRWLCITGCAGWGSWRLIGKSFTRSACGASAWNSDTVSVLCRERLWVVVDLKKRYRNSLNGIGQNGMDKMARTML